MYFPYSFFSQINSSNSTTTGAAPSITNPGSQPSHFAGHVITQIIGQNFRNGLTFFYTLSGTANSTSGTYDDIINTGTQIHNASLPQLTLNSGYFLTVSNSDGTSGTYPTIIICN